MQKTLYNGDAKKVIFDNCNPIARGCYGNVFRIADDKCLKVFDENYPYDLKMFDIMMDLDLANFYKIYDIYYMSNGNLGGYTMKYYENHNIDILTMPMDYTLDNMMSLYNQFDGINRSKIFVKDLHSGNVIINEDFGIIVIDIDLYERVVNKTIEQATAYNMGMLSNLFHQLYWDALYNFHRKTLCNGENGYKLGKVFTEDRDPLVVCKKLIKYKYPIDILGKGE